MRLQDPCVLDSCWTEIISLRKEIHEIIHHFSITIVVVLNAGVKVSAYQIHQINGPPPTITEQYKRSIQKHRLLLVLITKII